MPYGFTEKGLTIAQDSGLEKLGEKLVSGNSFDPLINEHSERSRYSIDLLDSFDVIHAIALREARARLKRDPESRILMVRLQDPDIELGNWRHRIPYQGQGRLFASEDIESFSPATEHDKDVLSGVIGLQYFRRKAFGTILSSRVFEGYGNSEVLSTAAFVGAYLLEKAALDSYDALDETKGSSFTYMMDGLVKHVKLYNDMDGDFTIEEATGIAEAVVTPHNESAEFFAKKEASVKGRHAIDDLLISGLLRSTYVYEGDEGVRRLLADCDEILRSLADSSGELHYNLGAFGDFGDRETREAVDQFRFTYQHDWDPKRGEISLLRTMLGRGGSIHFNLVGTSKGVVFRNIHSERDAVFSEIFVPRAHYKDIFRALLASSMAGNSRTAPTQILELLRGVQQVLNSSSSEH